MVRYVLCVEGRDAEGSPNSGAGVGVDLTLVPHIQGFNMPAPSEHRHCMYCCLSYSFGDRIRISQILLLHI